MALWGGRFEGKSDPLFRQFNDSLRFDARLVEADIFGSKAWASALVRAGVLTAQERDRLHAALDALATEAAGLGAAGIAASGEEDVHSWVESRLIASIGGVLLVWYNSLISPGSIGTGALINVLIVAVLGGMGHPIGAFVGAVVFVLLQNFAIDLVDRERFNLVIGVVFLAIVLFSPDGLLGLWAKLRSRFGPNQTVTSPQRRH